MTSESSSKPPEASSSFHRQDAQLPPPLPKVGEGDSQRGFLIGLFTVLGTFVMLVLLALILSSLSEKPVDSLGDTTWDKTAVEDLVQGEGKVGEIARKEVPKAKGKTDPSRSGGKYREEPASTSDPRAEEKQKKIQSSGLHLDGEEQVATTALPLPEQATDQSEDDRITARSDNRFFTLGSKPDIDDDSRPKKPSVADRGSKAGLEGRRTGNKEDLLSAYGGTAVTEGAVKLGLEWLARNQRADGLWSLSGPYENPGIQERIAAASAMALLAYQGAGHTPAGDRTDPFTQVVTRGWKGLLAQLNPRNESQIRKSIRGGYTEAICTIALCELYGMTRERRYRRPAQEALEYCIAAQSSQGGWRYTPNTDSDTSVTGWYLMALQSARMAGLSIDKQVFRNVAGYLDNAASHSGERYGYQPGAAASLSMTAEGLLCRQYLGWKQDDSRLIGGTTYLLENLPSWNARDVYYWYYATQVAHHMEGMYWDKWNSVMRELLPAKQVKQGAERGSWDPQGDKYGRVGGRLYVTCLCLYQLEVYYRYLPIYQQKAVGTASP